MVMRRNFFKDQSGLSLTEGLIAFPLVLLSFAVIIELGVAISQWNQTVKALELGARLAAVSDPLPTDAAYDALTDDWPSNSEGQAPPATAVTVTCGAGVSACDATEMNRLIYGSDGVCNPNFGTSLPGVCDFNRNITADHLRISYSRSGLGYVGRPGGPISTITVEAVDLSFDFFFLGALLGLNSFSIPANPVTVTSEDLSSTAP